MRMIAMSVVAMGFGLAAISASQAMPINALGTSASKDVIRVADFCGWGFHRGPYGGCRPMYNCPIGWHPGPFGRRCFRNGW